MSDDYNPYSAPESDLSQPDITVPVGEKYTPLMVEHLKNTRPWVMFWAILLIVLSAFMVLGAFGMFGSGALMGSAYSQFSNTDVGFIGAPFFILIGLVYIGLAGAYVPMIVFLFRYAISIKNLLNTGKTVSIEQALGHQKSYWKYVGIMAIVGIGLVIIAIPITCSIAMMNLSNFY